MLVPGRLIKGKLTFCTVVHSGYDRGSQVKTLFPGWLTSSQGEFPPMLEVLVIFGFGMGEGHCGPKVYTFIIVNKEN